MRLLIKIIEGEPDEVVKVYNAIKLSCNGFSDDSDPDAPVSFSSTASAEASTEAATPKPERIGFAQRMAMRKEFVRSRAQAGQGRIQAAIEFFSLDDDDLIHAVYSVASTNGISVQAFGDGQIFKQFLDFISAHWGDILKLLLPLLGL